VDEVTRLLRTMAAAGIQTSLPSVTEVNDRQLYEALHRTGARGLEGHAYMAVLTGRLTLSASQRAALAVLHRRGMVRALRVEQALLRLTDELQRRAVPFRLLKGVALARLAYPSPECRTFLDADLLIHPGMLGASVDAAESLGAWRIVPEIRPGFDEAYGKAVTVVLDGIALDLHRTLVAGPYGVRLDHAALFADPSPVAIGGQELPALGLHHLLLHAALSAGAGDDPPRLVTLSDIALLESHPRLDVDAVVRAAERWRLTVPVARGIARADEVLRPIHGSALNEWSARAQSSWLEGRILRSYLGPGRTYRRTVTTLLELPTWAARAAFLRGIVMPGPEYRAARRWTRGEHLRRGVTKLTGRSP
jgi:hypothetical protein